MFSRDALSRVFEMKEKMGSMEVEDKVAGDD